MDHFKEFNTRIREAGDDVPSFRILTDISGPLFTVVTEVEFESLAASEGRFREAMARPWAGEWFGRMVSLVESSSREFYTLVS